MGGWRKRRRKIRGRLLLFILAKNWSRVTTTRLVVTSDAATLHLQAATDALFISLTFSGLAAAAAAVVSATRWIIKFWQKKKEALLLFYQNKPFTKTTVIFWCGFNLFPSTHLHVALLSLLLLSLLLSSLSPSFSPSPSSSCNNSRRFS